MAEVATKSDLKEAVHVLTLRIGAMLGAAVTIALAAAGILVSIR